MVEVLPFRGILYNSSRFPDLSKVTCPPYDVISPEERDRYYELDPNNCIRLILGKELPQDTQEENWYSRAASYFETWLSHGILLQDTTPAFYFVEERYLDDHGKPLTRFGMIGLVRLMDYVSSSVRPHESTHEGPKRDRLELMKATKANFSQILTLYTDTSHTLEEVAEKILQDRSRLQVLDLDGIQRRLYSVTDPVIINQVQDVFIDKELMIADGHHRYETALAYRDLNRSREGFVGRPQAYDYMMIYLTNTEGQGLTIYPTHRVLTNYSSWNPRRFLRQIQELFDVEHISGGMEPEGCRRFLMAMNMRPAGQVTIGMKCKAMDGYFVLTLRDHRLAEQILGNDVPPALRKLDVKILHTIVLGHYLGIDPEEQERGGKILYVKGTENAIKMMEEDLLHQAIFFLNPPTIPLIREVVGAGEKMPQKSTFFYPKLLTGLVFRKMDEWDGEG